MSGLSPARRLLKVVHVEGIPWPGSAVYNAFSGTWMFQRHYEWLARDILHYCSEGSILDIGTGPGWLLLKLHQAAPGVQLTGVDISAAMVDKARKNVANAGLADVIAIKEGAASQLPFPEASFDAVVSTGSLHHWKDPTAGLNDVYRVLKPGGDALMYDVVSDTPSPVWDEGAREFGRLKIMLFWLHTFEEPFYTQENYRLLARPTLFQEGQTRFLGVMCCLVLKK